MPYAVGQGALAIVSRLSDLRISKIVSTVSHRNTTWECLCERSLLRYLEGGCKVPIGVRCSCMFFLCDFEFSVFLCHVSVTSMS